MNKYHRPEMEKESSIETIHHSGIFEKITMFVVIANKAIKETFRIFRPF